ncbi:unnamed protein product [Strongylus vulgaris]|uniref:tRNA/rRNA methyltransferase SpoU type domain-containing protein n=1 Tax=Strongylus vulgaris TaxID=40348 RepID=A0A3P7I978_STRVU|nr:unnamed protein product [Strongylus vulgaris]
MEDREGVRTCVTCELFAERTKEGSRLVAEVPLDATADGVTPGNSLLAGEEPPAPRQNLAVPDSLNGYKAALLAVDRKLKWASEKVERSENVSEIRELFALIDEGMKNKVFQTYTSLLATLHYTQINSFGFVLLPGSSNFAIVDRKVEYITTLPMLRPTLSRRTLYGTPDGSTSNNRPNLIYRKAKVTGRSLEELRSLSVPVPKFRGEPVFGIYPVLEALATGARDFFGLYVKDSVRQVIVTLYSFAVNYLSSSRSGHDERIAKILEHARTLDASPLRFAHNVSDTQFTSIFLDNVLDPGNFGAIARSALFFGCEQIVYAEGRGPSKITPAMSKASCGALECFRVIQVSSFLSFYKALKSAGALFIGTSDANSARKFGKLTIALCNLEVEKSQKLVLVLVLKEINFALFISKREDVK